MMNEKTMARQHLLAEMESLKGQVKLTPEERRKEVRRQMYVALKALEMERRQRVALEDLEKCKRDREEREREAESQRRQREKSEEERMRQEGLEKQKQDELKRERLQWESLMMKEEYAPKPRYTLSALKKEQEKRREELRRVVGDKADPESLTSDLKPAEPKRETLYNNWVGEEKVQPDSSVHLLFAAKPGPKPEEKPNAPKSNGALQWMQDRLKVEHWVDRYRDHREQKREKRKLKAEEQHTRWTTYKSSHTSQYSQLNDCYTGGFATSRNSILKSSF